MSDDDVEAILSKKDEFDRDEPEDAIQLSDNLFMFRNRTIGQHNNVLEGEIRSSVYGVRPCVIKFARISEQNVREAEILTKLGSHTNVISIIQSGTYCDLFEDSFYIALDKCHNENLRQYLVNRKTAGIEFDLNQAIDFAKQITVGVTYIHEHNVIHLDLKPSNILISQGLRLIKIADFGLSIVVKSPKSKVFHKRQFGTNGYRPIESFGNCEVSMRTDIFSLGTVLLHLLSNGNDVFGVDEHAFANNVMNDVTNTSGLLVCNPVTTEHLIKCMVNKERYCRPSIWEVFDHPCWTGKEVECDFEYRCDDEVDDNAPDDVDVEIKKEIASISDIERGRKFLAAIREMGFNRKPTILVFDKTSQHILRIDFAAKSMTRMWSYPKQNRSAAVAFDEYIYLFSIDFDDASGFNRSISRLEYGDVKATWERQSWPDWNEEEATPNVAASSDAAFLVSGYGKKSISKYDLRSNKWKSLPVESPNFDPAVLCNEKFLYCIGGWDRFRKPTNRVERLNLEAMKWERLADMNKRPPFNVAVECGGSIYVVRQERDTSNEILIERYDPEVDNWTELTPMYHSNPGETVTNAFSIGKDLYMVSVTCIQRYDVKRNDLSIFASFPGVNFEDAVLVKMSD